MVIFRISTYVYAFCIKFQCEFNYDACFAIRLTYCGNFQNEHIYIYAFCIKFRCEFNHDACLISQLTQFGIFWNWYIYMCHFASNFNVNSTMGNGLIHWILHGPWHHRNPNLGYMGQKYQMILKLIAKPYGQYHFEKMYYRITDGHVTCSKCDHSYIIRCEMCSRV